MEPSVASQLSEPLQAFARLDGLHFGGCDRRHGDWRNYFVGIVGDMGPHEEDIMWPNQVQMFPHSRLQRHFFQCRTYGLRRRRRLS